MQKSSNPKTESQAPRPETLQTLHSKPKQRVFRDSYYWGRNNYLYHFGGSLLSLWYHGPQNPILIIKAPTLHHWPPLRQVHEQQVVVCRAFSHGLSCLGFRVGAVGFRAGLRCPGKGLGFRVEGVGVRAQGLGPVRPCGRGPEAPQNP